MLQAYKGSSFVLFIPRVKPIKAGFMFSWNNIFLERNLPSYSLQGTTPSSSLAVSCQLPWSVMEQDSTGTAHSLKLCLHKGLEGKDITIVWFRPLILWGKKPESATEHLHSCLPRDTCVLTRLSPCHQLQRRHKAPLCLPHLQGPDKCSQLTPERPGPTQN